MTNVSKGSKHLIIFACMLLSIISCKTSLDDEDDDKEQIKYIVDYEDKKGRE